jgi:tryptophan 2,3-dioxygenase
MQKDYIPVYYPEYLRLDLILGAQELKSATVGEPAHDENLFIIVHQIYELWFKQILIELDDVLRLFSKDNIPERDLGVALQRVDRIIEIQKVLLAQLKVIETMTPLDFLDFRDLLVPASGFQSIQFREVESKLGLKMKDRVKFDQMSFGNRISKEHQKYLNEIEAQPGLFQLLEVWLERLPFLKFDEFDFWSEYKLAVIKMLDNEREIVNNRTNLTEVELKQQLREHEVTRNSFRSLYDIKIYEKLVESGQFKISQKALLSALFISLYRDEPMLQQPYRLISRLIDLDQNFTAWRYSHAMMAHRMLGTKIGTGGSAGHHYLKATADNNRIFEDLFNISTFLIPRSSLPILPKQLKEALDFHFQG